MRRALFRETSSLASVGIEWCDRADPGVSAIDFADDSDAFGVIARGI